MRVRYLTILLVSLCFPLLVNAQSIALQSGMPATEKRAWMGVSVAPAPASLLQQLKTPEGVGLIIAFVQPKSPADDAGLKPFDLLLKLDDQWLVNPEQFAVLVRMHHAGDEVKLSFVREGAEESSSVKLIEHDVPKALEFDGEIPLRLQNLPEDSDRKPGPMAEAEKIVTWLDGGKQVSVVTSGGHNTLNVKDNESGRLLFSGPIDTEDQRKNLPPDIRSKLDSLSQITSEFEGKTAPHGEGEKPARPNDSEQKQPEGPGSR